MITVIKVIIGTVRPPSKPNDPPFNSSFPSTGIDLNTEEKIDNPLTCAQKNRSLEEVSY